MAQEDTPNKTQQQIVDDTQRDIQSIAADVDFKPYIDAVNAAAQRTRSTIYILIAALLLIITVTRRTDYPDWMGARLGQLQLASVCLENNLTSSECTDAINYAQDLLYSSPQTKEISDFPSTAEFKRELQEQIAEIIKQRTEALVVHLPFFGIAIDINDLGLVGGLLLLSILCVLYASLSREVDNIERTKKNAIRSKARNMGVDNLKDSLELLIMAQVFASPPRATMGIKGGIYVLYFLTPASLLWVCVTDAQTYSVGFTLEGKTGVIIEALVEWTIFALVLVCSYLCYRQQRKLNRSLDDLEGLL